MMPIHMQVSKELHLSWHIVVNILEKQVAWHKNVTL